MGLGRTLQFCESGSTIELGDFPIMVRVRGKKLSIVNLFLHGSTSFAHFYPKG